MFRAPLFEYLNARLSVGARLAIIAACIAPPLALLLFLYVGQLQREIRFADREQAGAAFLSEVWPALTSPMTLPPDVAAQAEAFSARAEFDRFAAARGAARVQAGAGLIRQVADSSNLTLDNALGSFYAADAATVELPQLAAATATLAEAGPEARAPAASRLTIYAQAANAALRSAMRDDPSGEARQALAPAVAALAAAARNGATVEPAALQKAIDTAWRANARELRRMLEVRAAGLKRRLMINLCVVAIALIVVLLMMVATARGLTDRLRGLVAALDRIGAGDVTAQPPFLSDRNEIGRLAQALAQLKQSRMDAVAEQLRVEAATAAAQASEARLAFLAEHMSDLVIRYDRSHRRTFVSGSVRIYGYEPEVLVGQPGFTLFHPDNLEAMRAATDAAFAAGKSVSQTRVEVQLQTADGGWAWLEGAPTPIPNGRGELVEVAWVMRDITARKGVEAELEASSHRIREGHRVAMMAEELAGVGVWRRDMKTGEVYWSDGVFEIFGFDARNGPPPVGSAYALYAPEDRERIGAALRRTQTSGEPYDYETRVERPDGSVRRVRARGAAERNAAGEIVTVFGIIIDVTEAHAREQALRDSEARYRLLTERATDIIIRYDLEGVIEFASPAVSQLGYRPEDMVGRSILDFIDQSRRAQWEAALEIVRRGGLPREGAPGEFRILKADGEWIWLQGSPATLRDDEGTMIGVVTVLRDVTARRAADAELRRKQAEAEAAAQAKSEFLANMSHEIRTPLTGVIGFAGLMAKLPDLPDKAQTYAQRILTGGQALLSLVNDILEFSRLEAGQIELDRRPERLGSLLQDTIELVRPEAATKGLSLTLDLAGSLSEQVEIDAERVRQVLLNLIGNAIKFTSEGGIEVSVARIEGDAERLRIAVRDTGVGISAEHGDRLFQRFSQVDNSNTRRFGGAGLGLAISKGLVELMGGEIGVDSEEGRGSTFWFTLDAPAAAGAAAVAEAGATSPDLTPLRILVVDDVAVNRELVTALLSPFDLQLTEASNGAEAVEAANADPFDLILMDLQMPVMDGLAATRAIREGSSRNAATPILAVSANVMAPHVEACIAAGMNDHIAKPIDPKAFLSKIARWTAA